MHQNVKALFGLQRLTHRACGHGGTLLALFLTPYSVLGILKMVQQKYDQNFLLGKVSNWKIFRFSLSIAFLFLIFGTLTFLEIFPIVSLKAGFLSYPHTHTHIHADYVLMDLF